MNEIDGDICVSGGRGGGSPTRPTAERETFPILHFNDFLAKIHSRREQSKQIDGFMD